MSTKEPTPASAEKKPLFDMRNRDDRIGVYVLCVVATGMLMGFPLTLIDPSLAPWPGLAALGIGLLVGGVVVGSLARKEREAGQAGG